jgi:hypothetical protein
MAAQDFTAQDQADWATLQNTDEKNWSPQLAAKAPGLQLKFNAQPSAAAPAASPPPAPTPSPTPTPAPDDQVSGYGDSAAVTGAAKQPDAPPVYNQHGYFQPTDEQFSKFQQAVAAGYPLDQIDPRYKASMYLRAGGDPYQDFDHAKTLVIDPARDAQDAQHSQDIQQVVTNPLQFAVDKVGDAWNAVKAVGGQAWDFGVGLHKELQEQVAGDKYALHAGLSLATFNPGQAAADWDQANQHFKTAGALVTDASMKGISDVANQITMAATYLPHLAYDAVRTTPGVPQDVKDAAKEVDDHIIYQVTKFQVGMNKWSDGFTGKMTQSLAGAGVISQATADQAKAAASRNTPQEVSGLSMGLNPLNFVGPGIALHGLGMATKPVFKAAIEESGQRLANLAAEEGSITSRLAEAKNERANWQPVNPGDGAPMPRSPPELDKNINDLQTNLNQLKQQSQAALVDHQRQITQAGNSMQTSAGAASRIAGTLSQGAGQGIGLAVKGQKFLSDGLDNIAMKLAGGNPAVAVGIKHLVADVIATHLPGSDSMSWMWSEGGLFGGPVMHSALKMVGMNPADIGVSLNTIGKEFLAGEATSPFWRRVGEQTTGAPQWVARAMDNSFVNDVTKTFSGAANAGLESGAINAAIANAGSWGNPQATSQGFVTGSILGMVGGGFKVWRDYGTPDQINAAQVGDRYRFLQSLDTDAANQFKKLTPEAQLTMGSNFSQHPELGLKFDQPPGSGSVYRTNQPATKTDGYTATIHVDPSQPETAILAQVQHEFNHHLEQRGMAGELYAKLLGDPRAGTPGTFTKLDNDGNPVKRATGEYDTSNEFEELRNKLSQRYAAAGHPNEVLTDKRVVRELASESAVARVSPGSVVPPSTLAGKLLDLGTSPFVNKNFVKTVLASLGNGFDPTNQIVGTGLFTGEKRIPIVDSILKEWYEGRRQQGPLDSGDPTFITTKDLIGKTDAQVRAQSGAVDAWATNKNGSLVRRVDGSPVLKSTGQIDSAGNKVGQAIHAAISRMDEGQREAAGIRSDGEGGYRIMDVQKAQALLERQLPPKQMDVLNSIKGVMDNAPGGGVAMRYHPVYYRGKFKQPIAAALPIKDVSAMPMFTRVTKAGNLLIHAVDHGQLLENAAVQVKKGNGSEWGYKPAAIVEAARTMLEAIAKDQPSESVVTPSQKRFLYELTGLDPKVNGQDVFSDISKPKRSESIWKTYRVDRIHSATVDGTHNWKLQSDIYDALKGYRSGNRTFQEVLAERQERARELDEAKNARENPQAPLPPRTNVPRTDLTAGEPLRNQNVTTGQPYQRQAQPQPQSQPQQVTQNVPPTQAKSSTKSVGQLLAQRAQINGPETARSGLAASMASQSSPEAFRNQLGQAAKARVKEIAEPAVQAARPALRAQLVQPEVRRAQPADAGRQLTNVPERDVRMASLKPTNRLGMAHAIMSMETDLSQGLKIEQLPPGDRSGPGYEVAGITPKWDGPMAGRLAHLVQTGQQKQALQEAEQYIANQTDAVYKYAPKSVLDKHPETEFYLRDIAFHQGEEAVKRILARSLDMGPQYLNSDTAAAGIEHTPNLLEALKQTRQLYVQLVQHPAANLYRGVINRTNIAQQKALAFR